MPPIILTGRWSRRFWHEFTTPYEPDPRLDMLTPGQRSVYALKWLEAEVCNGGFAQYFTNSTGFLWPEAVAGAEIVGVPELSDLLRRAARPLGEPYPRERARRESLFDLLPDTYDDFWVSLDDRFDELIDGTTRAMLDYIERHPEEFSSILDRPVATLTGTRCITPARAG